MQKEKRRILIAFLTAFCLWGSSFACASQHEKWTNSTDIPVQTIFYQGMGGSQTIGAKYTGKHGFIATTGEQVININGIDIIQNLYAKPEIDEVIPASTIPSKWPGLRALPKALLQTAYTKVFHWGTRFANYYYGTQVKAVENQKHAQSIAAYVIDISKINIAQEGDIASCKRKFLQCRAEHPDADIVMCGVSRGAATTFQTLAELSKAGVDLSKVKLCLLEGCFDTVPNIMAKRHPWLLSNAKVMDFVARIASKIISFKKDGPSPLAAVNDFPKTIPVAFITSLKDKEVPAENTRNLVDKLLKAGHPAVYLLTLQNSSHPRYMLDDKGDIEAYKNFSHALYHAHGLPCILENAQAGKNLVEQCRVYTKEQL
jgi:hypothetical protein